MTYKNSLANQLLIAMPSLDDGNFKRSLIYICEHHEQGSVGLVINQPMTWPLGFVFEQLNIEANSQKQKEKPLLFGGPEQPERGFVIHRQHGAWQSSLMLQEDVTVTTSNDIIRALATDQGPQDALVTLGYAGWATGQLEQEIKDDAWLVCPYASELLYDVPFENRWEAAGQSIGVNMIHFTGTSGHA